MPTLEQHAALIANLYTDLLINDRLQRQCGLRMAAVYERLQAATPNAATPSALWQLYLGIYESLWQLDRGSLGGPSSDDRILGDAWLGARLIRVYARDWLFAAGRFTALLLPYLVADGGPAPQLSRIFDTHSSAEVAPRRAVSTLRTTSSTAAASQQRPAHHWQQR